MCVIHIKISKKYFKIDLQIRNFRVRTKKINYKKKNIKLAFDKIDPLNIKLAFKELNHEIMKDLKLMQSDAKSKTLQNIKKNY